MARISTYNLDPNLQELDKFIGTDATDNGTKNFNIRQLGDFYTKSGLADATRLGYRFTIFGVDNTTDTSIPSGMGYLNFSSGRTFANLTGIRVGLSDIRGFGIGVLNQVLGDGGTSRVKIISTRTGENIGQGYYSVNDLSTISGAGGATTGYTFTLTAIAEGQENSLRFGERTDNDEEFIIIPLPSNVSGSGGGTTQNIFDAVVINGGTPQLAGSATDDLIFTDGAGIDITAPASSPSGGAGIIITHATPTGVATNTSNTGQDFIQNLTFDSFGHVATVTMGTAMGGGTSALPTNFNISGISSYASGASNSNIYTLTGQTGFTISNLVWSLVSPPTGVTINSSTGVVTDSNTTDRTGTYTVRATFDYVQTDLSTNTGTGEIVNHGVRIFAPYYSGIQTTAPTSFVANGALTRSIVELTSGGTVPFNSSSGTQEGILNLRDADFASPTFRTGGFLIITPEATLTDALGSGYTTYVFSLTPNSRLDLEVL